MFLALGHIVVHSTIMTKILSKLAWLSNQHLTGIVVLVALFLWDNRKEEEQLAQISQDEALSRLPLRLSTNRIVELVQLRDTCRPVSTDFASQSLHLIVILLLLNIMLATLFVLS